MATYKKPVLFTIELLTGANATVVWEFVSEDGARELFRHMTAVPAVLASGNAELDGKTIIGVNLVVWDAHPSHDNAVGMVLEQISPWTSE